MPGWGQVLEEIQQTMTVPNAQGPDFDGVRRKYLRLLHEKTGRAVLAYASGWLQGNVQDSLDVSVNGLDVLALMETCHGVTERELDLIIHSPGGSGTAAEQMLNYLRTRFHYIRAFVPLQAKSAATMIALGCDEIVLGAHSELGPIDPQIAMPVPGGQRFAPAHAIKGDFNRAREEIAKDINALSVWTPILHAYAGGLLTFCDQQIELSRDVVAGWLAKYMLSHEDAGVPEENRATVAGNIAEWFGSEKAYERFKEHGRPIRIEELETVQGLRVRRLESDQGLQDAVLSVFHAFDLTLSGPAVKIVENHLGKAYVKTRPQLVIQSGPPPGLPEPAPVPQATQPRSPYPPAASRPRKKRR